MNLKASVVVTSALASLAGSLVADASVTVISRVPATYTGSTVDLNVNISATGDAASPSPFFTVSGSSVDSGAFGGVIGITLDAMSDVNLSAAALGDEVADGSFNVDSAGYLGVAGGPNTGGIGGGATHEGIRVIFDELTSIAPTIGIRLTGISVRNVGRAGNDPVDESFTIVNLQTRDALTFTPVSESLPAGFFDVSSLNIYRLGGDSGGMASIISGDVGGFRVEGLTFESFVVPEPSVALLGGVGLFGLLRRRRA